MALRGWGRNFGCCRTAVIALFLMLVAGVARAEVMVYVPGAVAGAMEEVAGAARTAGVPFTLVGGHSPAQARQIAEGAPADLFIAADPEWMDFLSARHLLAEGSRTSLASTRLVLVAAVGSTLVYEAKPGESLSAAMGEGRLAICDPDSVPAGRYAQSALTRLGAWEELQGRLALLPDVRSVSAMVGRGEAPAGIAFASDVKANADVRVVIQFPVDVVPPVSFTVAVVAGRETEAVRRVYEFILSQGPAILRARGFEEPAR